jgi:F0F1-type ATP synthase assembly protein I
MPKPPLPNKLQLGPATGLVAYVLGAGGFGWGVDWLMQTLPWGLVSGVVVGFIGWIYVARQAEQG